MSSRRVHPRRKPLAETAQSKAVRTCRGRSYERLSPGLLLEPSKVSTRTTGFGTARSIPSKRPKLVERTIPFCIDFCTLRRRTSPKTVNSARQGSAMELKTFRPGGAFRSGDSIQPSYGRAVGILQITMEKRTNGTKPIRPRGSIPPNPLALAGIRSPRLNFSYPECDRRTTRSYGNVCFSQAFQLLRLS